MRETLCDECDDVLFVKERERERLFGVVLDLWFGCEIWAEGAMRG